MSSINIPQYITQATAINVVYYNITTYYDDFEKYGKNEGENGEAVYHL